MWPGQPPSHSCREKVPARPGWMFGEAGTVSVSVSQLSVFLPSSRLSQPPASSSSGPSRPDICEPESQQRWRDLAGLRQKHYSSDHLLLLHHHHHLHGHHGHRHGRRHGRLRHHHRCHRHERGQVRLRRWRDVLRGLGGREGPRPRGVYGA